MTATDAPENLSEQELLRDSARRLCAKIGGVPRFRERVLGGAARSPDWREVRDAGWLLVALDEKDGGLQQGVVGLSLLLREAGRELITLPVAHVVAALVSTATISPAKLKRLYRAIVDDGEIIVPAIQEDKLGFNLKGPGACSVSIGAEGHYLLSGRKVAVPYGDIATGFLVDAHDGHSVPAILHVPANTRGVHRSKNHNVDGTYSVDVEFRDVPLDHAQALSTGEEARAHRQLMVGLMAMGAASELVGIAERSFEMSLDYLKVRRQFGRLIGSFQSLQHLAAANFVDLELSLQLVRAAAQTMDDQHCATSLAFAAKAKCAETALSIAKNCVQSFGANGFTDGCDAHLYLRRAVSLGAEIGSPTRCRQLFSETHASERHETRVS